MATSTPGNKKRSASQNLSEEDTKKLKLNNSTSAADETTLSGETQGRDIYDEITKRNSENSPLLRLPAELRIKIYQYALGRYVLTPMVLLTQDRTRRYTIHCAVGHEYIDGWYWYLGKDLWLLVQGFSMSSRQLRAEIGEMLFTESPMRYTTEWKQVFPKLSKERKDAIRSMNVATSGSLGYSSVISDFFRMVDALSNVRTVRIKECQMKFGLHMKEYIVAETQKRGLKLIFDRL